MKIRVINEPQLYCEDSNGDFINTFKEGDCVKIKCTDGKQYEGSIDNIFSDTIELDTEEGFFGISYDDIEEIVEW